MNTLEIKGHPTTELYVESGPTLITVCASCGQMRTILFLTGDRWYCSKCRAEGKQPPNLFPLT